MNVFWNPDERRLRVLWRLIVQATIMAALALIPIVAIAEPLTALHRRGLFLPAYEHDAYDRVVNMIVGPFLAGAVIASVALACKWLDHRPMAELGARVDRRFWTGLGLGLTIGTMVMVLVFAVEYAFGWVAPTGVQVVDASAGPIGVALTYSLVKVLCVGTYEEFLSRGYHLRNVGVLFSSVIFALLHTFNENASVMSALGLFVNALFLATAVRVTGRLGTAIGAHIAWNLVQGAVFGFPVSGDKEGASLIGIVQRGPAFLTGGAFGPEAGLIGALASVAGIVLMLAWGRRQHRHERPTTS